MLDKTLKQLVESINAFSLEFKKEPYSYLLENDIQCALFAKLRKDINQHVDVVGINEDKYQLNIINSEYLDRFDICCLNKEKISKIKRADVIQNKGNDDYIYQLPVLLAIELKFIWARQRRSFDIFTSDVNKIEQSQFKEKVDYWLSICFIQTKNAMDWQLENSNKDYLISEIATIERLNTSYIVSPKATYKLEKCP